MQSVLCRTAPSSPDVFNSIDNTNTQQPLLTGREVLVEGLGSTLGIAGPGSECGKDATILSAELQRDRPALAALSPLPLHSDERRLDLTGGSGTTN